MDKIQAMGRTEIARQSRKVTLEEIEESLNWLQLEYKKLGLYESADLIENARVCIKGVEVLETP